MGKKITFILITLLLTNRYSSAQYNKGDHVDGGIVFYSSSEEIRIVSIAETTAQWQYSDSFTRTGATRRSAGKHNTDLMTHSPAKDWIDSLGEGWFLPTSRDLSYLRRQMNVINKALDSLGAPKLCNGGVKGDYWGKTCLLWSCEEDRDDPEFALAHEIQNGIMRALPYRKDLMLHVRGVKVIELSE